MGKGVIGLRLAEGEGSFLGQGLVVSGIVADPARDAGFQINDLVMQVNEISIKHMSDLPTVLGTVEPGTKLKFHITRFGKEMDLYLTVGHKPTLMEKLKGENKTEVSVGGLAADVKATPDRPITPPKASHPDKDHVKKPKQQSLPEGYVNPKVKQTKEKKPKSSGNLQAGYINPKTKHHKDITVAVDRTVDGGEEKSGGSGSGGSGGFFASLMPGSFKSHGRTASAYATKIEPPPSVTPVPSGGGNRPAPPPRRRSLIEKVKESNQHGSKSKKDDKKKDESRPRTPPRK